MAFLPMLISAGGAETSVAGGEKMKKGSETVEKSRQGSPTEPKKATQRSRPPAGTDRKAPATSPMVRGPTYCEAMPAADMETIMTLQRIDSMVLNTRPRNWFGVWRSSCALLSTLVTAIPTRENIINTSAAVYDSTWLNSM